MTRSRLSRFLFALGVVLFVGCSSDDEAPPSCTVAPLDPECVPGPLACDGPYRGDFRTEEAALASCEGPCTVCPAETIGEAIVSFMAIDAEGCACPLPIELEMLSCEEADLEVGRLRGALWRDPNTCVSDEECIAVPVDLECEEEGNSFWSCPFAIHVDSQDALDEVQAAVAEQACPLTSDCRAGPTCAPTEPRCVAFRCEEVLSGPGSCLQHCESLGCGDCAAYCKADPECAKDATSCEEVRGCGEHRVISAFPFDETARCLLPAVVARVLEEPLGASSGDLACGIGPDGRMYLMASGTYFRALGWPSCDGDDDEEVFSARACATD